MFSSLEIALDRIEEGLVLFIDEITPETLLKIPEEEAGKFHEAKYQLTEGFFYNYSFNKPEFEFKDVGFNIVRPQTRQKNIGTLAPNIYTGTLTLGIKKGEIDRGEIQLEVRSLKTSYREDYGFMLKYITEKATDLLLQANAPATHSFETDPNTDSRTLYQRFAFIRSVLDTDDFREAVNRIVRYPVTRWDLTEERKDISRIRKFSRKNIRELTANPNRTSLPDNHTMRKIGLESVPLRISGYKKIDSPDTPENRFVRHALEEFLNFLNQINRIASLKKYSRLKEESAQLISELETHLDHSLFDEVSRPHSLNLNSPALQRKEGYREILRVWLMFDLAAKLVWKGGEDVYEGGKKDVATLYEYWLFFKLLEILEDIFKIPSKEVSRLIEEDGYKLSLRIKQGKRTALSGIYDSGVRQFNIRFNYNRSFSGSQSYPKHGSWTVAMRPDYTLSVWPKGISEEEAEELELILHIHFDAKYKVENLKSILPDKISEEEEEETLNLEKEENKKGTYKNADLLKMHAYRDAIRRTGGAYVLYPGRHNKELRGFHEIIPGLGAFPVRPSQSGDDGTEALKKFILEVANNFINKTSQREKHAFHIYKTHDDKPDDGFVSESTPELLGDNRDLFPDETFVNVGFYKSPEHLEWIEKNGLYNLRTGTERGSVRLKSNTINARYLLLHGRGEMETAHYYKLSPEGPTIFSKTDLLKKDYPTKDDDKDKIYLVFKIMKDPPEREFENLKIDIRELKGYQPRRGSAEPFTVSLADLMEAKVDENKTVL